MRVMVIIKATKESEDGVMPDEDLLAQMGGFDEDLVNAGVLMSGDGLKPSSHGKRVKFSNGEKSVIDGPFENTQSLVSGFWIWKVESMDEAVEWVRRCPDPMPGGQAEIEIRPFYEMEDFGEELTPELRAQEDRLRSEIERQFGS
ncbi:YciI family protein [Phragmitibacter flavus]|uniref:YciI family protein n=1 Tax=Phragmitibacter flavus TaxID=2576071 RepID=A0A5R8KIQ7_9BACT|nr:YciI family protein [Phragmitibacter flavus]